MATADNGKRQPTQAHPYAEIFPLHDGQGVWDMADDIKANGQKDACVLFDGKMLDGRRRERACIARTIEPKYVTFRGTDKEALAFAISKNLHRRHLGESERAMVAAKLVQMHRASPDKKATSGSEAPIGASTQKEAADLLNVSRRSVQRAENVLNNGSSSLINAVATGKVSGNDGDKASRLPKKEQKRLVKQRINGRIQRLTEAETKGDSWEGQDDDHDIARDMRGNELKNNRLKDVFKSKLYADTMALAKQLRQNVHAMINWHPWVGNGPTLQQCEALVSHIESNVPWAICAKCNDRGRNGCDECKQQGWLPHWRYVELNAHLDPTAL